MKGVDTLPINLDLEEILRKPRILGSHRGDEDPRCPYHRGETPGVDVITSSEVSGRDVSRSCLVPTESRVWKYLTPWKWSIEQERLPVQEVES